MFLAYKDFNALILHVIILASFSKPFTNLQKDVYTVWFYLVFTFLYDLLAVISTMTLCCCGNNIQVLIYLWISQLVYFFYMCLSMIVSFWLLSDEY